MTKTPQERQDDAIGRADELLASVGLPLYGDISGTLAHIVGLTRAEATEANRAALRAALESAASLYAPPPPQPDPEAPRPVKLVNRAFSAMPYGGGVGFQAIAEADTKDVAYTKIARNLERLTDVLAAVGKDHDTLMAELGEYRAAIKGVGIACDLIERERQRRAASAPGARP